MERRNLVMSLIEKERLEKKEALDAARSELGQLPAQGSADSLYVPQ